MSKEQFPRFTRYINYKPKPVEPKEQHEIKEDKPIRRRPTKPAPISPYELDKQPKLTFVYYEKGLGDFA